MAWILRDSWGQGETETQREPDWQEEMRRKLREEQEARNRILHMREDSEIYFLRSEGYFCHDIKGAISSQEIYSLYEQWCEENRIVPKQPRTLWYHMKKYAAVYNIVPVNSLKKQDGTCVRGYRGIRALTPLEKNPCDT